MKIVDLIGFQLDVSDCHCSALCAVSLNGYIYVAGGYDGVSALSSVESYDPLSNTWRVVAPMQRARSAAAAVALSDCIYVIGGHDGSQIESSVQYLPVNTLRSSLL